MHNPKQLTALAGGILGLLALTACGSTSAGPTSAGPSAPAPVSSPAVTTSPVPSPSSSAATTTAACRSADLKVTDTADEGGGSAGHHTEYLVFENTSGHECTMRGYPGVSFVTGDSGQQVGSAFTRSPADKPATVLLPNGHAHATIQIASPGTTPDADCKPIAVRGYRIYPPDEKASIYVAKPQTACSAPGKGVGQVKPIIKGTSDS